MEDNTNEENWDAVIEAAAAEAAAAKGVAAATMQEGVEAAGATATTTAAVPTTAATAATTSAGPVPVETSVLCGNDDMMRGAVQAAAHVQAGATQVASVPTPVGLLPAASGIPPTVEASQSQVVQPAHVAHEAHDMALSKSPEAGELQAAHTSGPALDLQAAQAAHASSEVGGTPTLDTSLQQHRGRSRSRSLNRSQDQPEKSVPCSPATAELQKQEHDGRGRSRSRSRSRQVQDNGEQGVEAQQARSTTEASQDFSGIAAAVAAVVSAEPDGSGGSAAGASASVDQSNGEAQRAAAGVPEMINTSPSTLHLIATAMDSGTAVASNLNSAGTIPSTHLDPRVHNVNVPLAQTIASLKPVQVSTDMSSIKLPPTAEILSSLAHLVSVELAALAQALDPVDRKQSPAPAPPAPAQTPASGVIAVPPSTSAPPPGLTQAQVQPNMQPQESAPPPVPGLSVDRRYTGTISKFFAEKGFGFIDSAEIKAVLNGKDVFLHKGQLGNFQKGDAVSFSIVWNKDGKPQAMSLAPLVGGGLPPPGKGSTHLPPAPPPPQHSACGVPQPAVQLGSSPMQAALNGNNMNNGDRITRELPVPADVVGGVIGKQGSGIQELRRRAGGGVYIWLQPALVQGGPQMASISGPVANVEVAASLVLQKVQELQAARAGRA